MVNPSPPKISEIPAFKPRKSKDWEPNPTPPSDEYQLQLPPTANPEWVKRLKGADSSVIHRSVDCIANKVSFIQKVVIATYSCLMLYFFCNSKNC